MVLKAFCVTLGNLLRYPEAQQKSEYDLVALLGGESQRLSALRKAKLGSCFARYQCFSAQPRKHFRDGRLGDTQAANEVNCSHRATSRSTQISDELYIVFSQCGTPSLTRMPQGNLLPLRRWDASLFAGAHA